MRSFCVCLLGALVILNSVAQSPKVKVRNDPSLKLDLELPAPAVVGIETTTEIEGSDDCVGWQPLGTINNNSHAPTLFPLENAGERKFFRTRQKHSVSATRDAGADVYGYSAEYAKQLKDVGFLSVEAFTNAHPLPNYLPQLSWDPTTADFWAAFNLNTEEHNSKLPYDSPQRRVADFRLNESELAMFKKNGFVVSSRTRGYSFGDAFYRIFMDDLPVFISSDAILQAWHQVFKNLLTEWEVHYIQPELGTLLTNVAMAIGTLHQKHSGGLFAASVRDADVFVSVARSLLQDQIVPSTTGQDAEVARIVEAVRGEQYHERFQIFGSDRPMDFSQFTPRGNYTDDGWRAAYFRAMMWLGRVDLRVVDPEPGTMQSGSLRELAVAVALQEALGNSAGTERWKGLNDIIELLVGYADSMNFLQLMQLLDGAQMQTLEQIGSEANLLAIQRSILNGSLGFQQIRGDAFYAPLDGSQLKLPRSFAFSGPKFVLDSWVLTKVVYDDILWPRADGSLEKVERLMPTPLDVAFAALGNDNVVPLIARGIAGPSPNTWRDGHPYQHNLEATRRVIDAQRSTVWTNSSVYNAWLGALRTLSKPTVSADHAEVFRTKAWAMKQVQSQLASWTQLRHDTILYAKPSYTTPILCSYPEGYVEPAPDFWQQMGILTDRTRNAFQAVDAPEAMRAHLTNQLAHLAHFRKTMGTLEGLAQKELAHQPFSESETEFLRDVVEIQKTYNGKLHGGWYPNLFYRSLALKSSAGFHGDHGSEKVDKLVVDIHTKVPDERGPGRILHTAVGSPNMMLIAVECGEDKVVYAGPVFSYFEVEVDGTERLTNADWSYPSTTLNGIQPPAWTKEFLFYQP